MLHPAFFSFIVSTVLYRHNIDIIIHVGGHAFDCFRKNKRIIARLDMCQLCSILPKIHTVGIIPLFKVMLAPPENLLVLYTLSTLTFQDATLHVPLLIINFGFHFGFVKTDAEFKIVHLVEVHCLVASHTVKPPIV